MSTSFKVKTLSRMRESLMNMLCSHLFVTGLLSVDKHKVLAVFAKHGDWVPGWVVKELEQECSIPIKDRDS